MTVIPMTRQFERELEEAGAVDARERRVVVTPEMAERWLERNVLNRGLSPSRLMEMKGAIRRDEWELNGETIAFNEDGVLIDGQTRLTAISETGRSVESVVVYGLGTDAQATIDVGAPRNFADKLKMADEVNVKTLSSAVRAIHSYERTGHFSSKYIKLTPTFAQLSGVLERHPEIRASVQWADNYYKRSQEQLLSANTVAPLHYAMVHLAGNERDDVEAFFESVAKGQGLEEGDPVLALRTKLIKDRGLHSSQPKLPLHSKQAFTIKTFNDWMVGNKRSSLRWRMTGPRAEKYPRIRGEISWETVSVTHDDIAEVAV